MAVGSRLRHVIEPEVNVFTSAQTLSRDHLLQYDEPIDEVNDISARNLTRRIRSTAAMSMPLASCGVDGATIFSPGTR